MTKEEAQKELQSPIYPKEQLELDFPFVLKKLGFTEKEFYEYLDGPRKEYKDYGYIRSIYSDLQRAFGFSSLFAKK